jgi:antitoxin component of MazEF toxin-antitoxin module
VGNTQQQGHLADPKAASQHWAKWQAFASNLALIIAFRLGIHKIFIRRCRILAKIQKWGNSQELRLSKNLLTDAQLDIGDVIDISVRDGIMVEQVKSVDFRSRRANRIERTNDKLLSEVLSILDACIY